MKATFIFLSIAIGMSALGCFNSGPHKTMISSTRFAVETGSAVLGARQLLLDTSNGDVWVLEGVRDPEPRWVLLARGPEDIRVIEDDLAPEWMPQPPE